MSFPWCEIDKSDCTPLQYWVSLFFFSLELKNELRAIFENFGDVRDIVAMKSFWRRGQAWIIFAHQAAADKALSALQGFPYQGKEMVRRELLLAR